MVGDQQQKECYYEPQNLDMGGMASRKCIAHRQWAHPSNYDSKLTYDGSKCVTRSTAELRNLSRV